MPRVQTRAAEPPRRALWLRGRGTGSLGLSLVLWLALRESVAMLGGRCLAWGIAALMPALVLARGVALVMKRGGRRQSGTAQSDFASYTG